MTPFEVIELIASKRGVRRILDVGCGGGELLAQLAGAGYEAAGVEPGDAAVSRARKRNPKLTIVQSGAERLPEGLADFDMAVMVNALHHVPVPAMAGAISEAGRVLRPKGVLVVLEPAAHGSFFTAMLPLEDETLVRAAAQTALGAAVASGKWRISEELNYERVEQFANADAFIDRVVAVDPARLEAAQRKRQDIHAAFAEQAQLLDTGLYQLANPMIVKVFEAA